MTVSADGLESAFAAPARIAIMTRLLIHKRLQFSRLQAAVALTSGNLASHLAALQKEGFVEQRDSLTPRGQARVVLVTPAGDERFRRHITRLEELLRQIPNP
jgi:DNA-binding MarR family transcriptional regulator